MLIRPLVQDMEATLTVMSAPVDTTTVSRNTTVCEPLDGYVTDEAMTEGGTY